MSAPGLFLIAGMPRSGSTFGFNIAREILLRRGKVFWQATDSFSRALSEPDAQFVLIKAHSADEDTIGAVKGGAARAICTVRKPEDAIASWMETFDPDLERALGTMVAWLRLFEQIREYALVIDYDEIETAPFQAALQIGRRVAPDATSHEIREITTKYLKPVVWDQTQSLKLTDAGIRDVGFSYYNRETFFHRRHVSSLVSRPAEERIGPASVSRIRKTLAAYLGQDGTLL